LQHPQATPTLIHTPTDWVGRRTYTTTMLPRRATFVAVGVLHLFLLSAPRHAAADTHAPSTSASANNNPAAMYTQGPDLIVQSPEGGDVLINGHSVRGLAASAETVSLRSCCALTQSVMHGLCDSTRPACLPNSVPMHVLGRATTLKGVRARSVGTVVRGTAPLGYASPPPPSTRGQI